MGKEYGTLELKWMAGTRRLQGRLEIPASEMLTFDGDKVGRLVLEVKPLNADVLEILDWQLEWPSLQ